MDNRTAELAIWGRKRGEGGPSRNQDYVKGVLHPVCLMFDVALVELGMKILSVEIISPCQLEFGDRKSVA